MRLPAAVRERRERRRAATAGRCHRSDPGAEHHHFAGASLGVTAETYRRVGGLDACAALEDQAFGAKLARHGIPVVRAADVRVRTSARTDGRARRGLSVDLAVSTWREQRRYRADAFDAGGSARRQADHDGVGGAARQGVCRGPSPGVLETTVGAGTGGGAGGRGHRRRRGVAGRHRCARGGAGRGGSAAGRAAARARAGTGQGRRHVAGGGAQPRRSRLLPGRRHRGSPSSPSPGSAGPAASDPQVALVKGAFDRPFRAGGQNLPHEGGRVTEVMARPLLNLHFPLLAGFAQPLAGEFGARRDLLMRIPFPVGYGVEIAVLIDALEPAGCRRWPSAISAPGRTAISRCVRWARWRSRCWRRWSGGWTVRAASPAATTSARGRTAPSSTCPSTSARRWTRWPLPRPDRTGPDRPSLRPDISGIAPPVVSLRSLAGSWWASCSPPRSTWSSSTPSICPRSTRRSALCAGRRRL